MVTSVTRWFFELSCVSCSLLTRILSEIGRNKKEKLARIDSFIFISIAIVVFTSGSSMVKEQFRETNVASEVYVLIRLL